MEEWTFVRGPRGFGISAQQFYKDFVGNAEFVGSEADDGAVALDEAGRFERGESFIERSHAIGGKFAEIDAGELTQAEKDFFFPRLVGSDGFDLLGGKFA